MIFLGCWNDRPQIVTAQLADSPQRVVYALLFRRELRCITQVLPSATAAFAGVRAGRGAARAIGGGAIIGGARFTGASATGREDMRRRITCVLRKAGCACLSRLSGAVEPVGRGGVQRVPESRLWH